MYQYVGYATESDEQCQEILSFFPDLGPIRPNRDLVLFYLVDPERLWKACLQGEHISSEEIFEEFIGRFNDERKQS